MSSNPLQTPSRPFAQTSNSSASSLKNGSSTPNNDGASTVSLSVNYLPSKFSGNMLEPGPRRRKGKSGLPPMGPKRGGGVDAFRAGESRMPGANDEDYDGVEGWFKKGANGSHKRMRWTKFKWALFLANTILTVYSFVALIFCLLIWFNVFTHADIIRIGNTTELALSTIAASLGILTCVIGWAGILLNNRMFLAIYSFMLWIVLAFIAAPGYVSYKRRTFNIEGKVNREWSQDLGSDGRLRIQNQLGCCGYFSPFVEATVSQTCYSRSVLSGCKLPYMEFQRRILQRWYTVAFAIVPAHIAIMIAGLLCSNHVTYRFGKGMMPKAYRLSLNSMAVIMDNYANQLAEQYGNEVASDVMARSRTNLAQIESMASSMNNSTSALTAHPGYAGGDRH